MSKLEKMKNSLLSSIEIDMQQIEEIKQQPQSQIDLMGGVKERKLYRLLSQQNINIQTATAYGKKLKELKMKLLEKN